MKNKSKLAQVRATSAGIPNVPTDWFYMCPAKITVSDIKKSLDNENYDIEIWHDAGILEIGFAEKSSLDIETAPLDMGDEYSNEYITSHNITSLFYVTFKIFDYKQVTEIMRKITKELGGFFCADSDDFSPTIS